VLSSSSFVLTSLNSGHGSSFQIMASKSGFFCSRELTGLFHPLLVVSLRCDYYRFWGFDKGLQTEEVVFCSRPV
jgi:hypothetical protein